MKLKLSKNNNNTQTTLIAPKILLLGSLQSATGIASATECFCSVDLISKSYIFLSALYISRFTPLACVTCKSPCHTTPKNRQEECRESLQKYMGLFWLFLVGCFEPVLAHHGLVLAHLGTVFALFGPAVGCLDSSWACLRHRWQPG